MEEGSLGACSQIQVCSGHDGKFLFLLVSFCRVMVDIFEHRESLWSSWHFGIMR